MVLAAAAACDIPSFTLDLEPPVSTYGAPVAIAEANGEGRLAGHRIVPRVVRNAAGWKQALPPQSYRIVRLGGTEIAYSGRFDDFYAAGLYSCVACGTPQFASRDKYDSRTGWPSFTKPFAASNQTIEWDYSWGLRRRAVICIRCGAHLGHVFNDGPLPTLRRYCINSLALSFVPSGR